MRPLAWNVMLLHNKVNVFLKLHSLHPYQTQVLSHIRIYIFWYRPRQFGHQTSYASIGNRYFFTISCNCQTYQIYEQSQQKLGTYLENKVLRNQSFQKISFLKGLYPSLIFFTEKKSERFHWFLMLKNDFESTNFAIFEEVVHNFGRSDDDMI